MTDITIATSAANRKELAEAFGQNQSAVRRLEAMTTDIRTNLPNAIEQSGGAALLLSLLLNGQVAPALGARDGVTMAMLLAESMTKTPVRPDSGMQALMQGNAFTAQAPGAYKVTAPGGVYQKASSTGNALTSGVVANACSIPLSAGTWDVSGIVVFNSGAATVVESITAGVSPTSATLGTPDTYQQQQMALSGTPAFNLWAPPGRIVLANAATVYLVAESTFTTSTMSVDGYIQARPAF